MIVNKCDKASFGRKRIYKKVYIIILIEFIRMYVKYYVLLSAIGTTAIFTKFFPLLPHEFKAQVATMQTAFAINCVRNIKYAKNKTYNRYYRLDKRNRTHYLAIQTNRQCLWCNSA